ncbi:hypothetical protein F442_10311 [Phytophthora nicotianae P10297]|uniref:RxLR effector protein n=1 Tax=Phytophthora nicotianae P10297 TaxID=1317064 RepID=W2Z613_PHYNI|nr:hypothetical protein F442_10311 [Phytophthora nicotianae P10297]
MRVLHLALAFVVALSSINDGVTSASKTTLSSDSSDYPALRVSIASDKTNSEERRPIGVFGPVGKGNGGYENLQTRPSLSLDKKCCLSTFVRGNASMPSSSPS